MAHQNHNEKANYIFGRLPAINALESGKALKAYLQKGFSDERIISLCNKSKIQVMYVEADKLRLLTSPKRKRIH